MCDDLTAAELYWQYAYQGVLPAAVPIEVGDECGLSTSGFALDKPPARDLALSLDPRDRVAAAFHAIHDASIAVKTRYADVQVPGL